ncbi:MAG: DUF4293 domain-containing protein [Paludibacter sp.]|nr:DUF4293 domain-containing protein [Paludibacter sp.]
MWQRIQTLFLLFTVISTSIAAIVLMKMDNIFLVNALHNISIVLTICLYANIVAAFIAIFTIFVYKKRKLQIVFCNINIILMVLIFAIFAFIHISEMNFNFSINEIFIAVLTFFSLIFVIFAKKFIKKDEKKVRAWERVR